MIKDLINNASQPTPAKWGNIGAMIVLSATVLEAFEDKITWPWFPAVTMIATIAAVGVIVFTKAKR